jgi:hypothetical protein
VLALVSFPPTVSLVKSSNLIPTSGRFVRFGPVSQVNVQASPLYAETRDNPAECARECQEIANAHGLPVAFSCETMQGTFRHTFRPEREPIKVFHRNNYGTVRTYAADPDQALALHELTGTRTLEARHLRALQSLGFTLASVADPKAPNYGRASVSSLSLPSSV